jgi:hypothetical protein
MREPIPPVGDLRALTKFKLKASSGVQTITNLLDEPSYFQLDTAIRGIADR